MAHTLLTFLCIVGLAPNTGLAETIRPQMDRVAHEFVAGPAHANFAELARLVRHRSGPSDALEHIRAAVAVKIPADRGQQTLRLFWLRAGCQTNRGRDGRGTGPQFVCDTRPVVWPKCTEACT